jgi:hypothetical protein
MIAFSTIGLAASALGTSRDIMRDNGLGGRCTVGAASGWAAGCAGVPVGFAPMGFTGELAVGPGRENIARGNSGSFAVGGSLVTGVPMPDCIELDGTDRKPGSARRSLAGGRIGSGRTPIPDMPGAMPVGAGAGAGVGGAALAGASLGGAASPRRRLRAAATLA